MTPIEEFLELTKDIKRFPPTIKMRAIAKDLLNKETQMLDQLKAKHKSDVIKAYNQGIDDGITSTVNDDQYFAEQYYKDNHQNKEG